MLGEIYEAREGFHIKSQKICYNFLSMPGFSIP